MTSIYDPSMTIEDLQELQVELRGWTLQELQDHLRSVPVQDRRKALMKTMETIDLLITPPSLGEIIEYVDRLHFKPQLLLWLRLTGSMVMWLLTGLLWASMFLTGTVIFVLITWSVGKLLYDCYLHLEALWK
jgi:hypothetical protein